MGDENQENIIEEQDKKLEEKKRINQERLKKIQKLLQDGKKFKETVKNKLIMRGTDGDDILGKIPESTKPFEDFDKKGNIKDKAVHQQFVMDGQKGSDIYIVFPEINYSTVILEDRKTKASVDEDRVFVVFFDNLETTITVEPTKNSSTAIIKISPGRRFGLGESYIAFPTSAIKQITFLYVEKKIDPRIFNDLKYLDYNHLGHQLEYNFDHKEYKQCRGRQIAELYDHQQKNPPIIEKRK